MHQDNKRLCRANHDVTTTLMTRKSCTSYEKSLNSDGNYFHKYQQNDQSPLNLTELNENKKTRTCDVENLETDVDMLLSWCWYVIVMLLSLCWDANVMLKCCFHDVPKLSTLCGHSVDMLLSCLLYVNDLLLSSGLPHLVWILLFCLCSTDLSGSCSVASGNIHF